MLPGGSDHALSAEVSRLDAELRRAGAGERAEHDKRYLKSELSHHGVPVPDVRRATRAFLKRVGSLDRTELRLLVEELWRREVYELRLAAVEILVRERKRLTAEDAPFLERLLREARTWALLDPLATQVVGQLLQQDEQALTPVLALWSRDGDFWLRRSVLLAHLLAVRAGDAEALAAFGGYADALLEDREFFVRKAIGWVLREGTKERPDDVFAWLLPRVGRASGLTLREASRNLPPEQKEALRQATGR